MEAWKTLTHKRLRGRGDADNLFPLKHSRDAGGEHRPERPESVVIRHIEMPGHPTDMSHQRLCLAIKIRFLVDIPAGIALLAEIAG